MEEILIRKNFKNVVTVFNKQGDVEHLDHIHSPTLNVNELIQGVADLNRSGIIVSNIVAGKSREGVTKIQNIHDFHNSDDTLQTDTTLPEGTFIPFKSDAWILGEYIVRLKTKKAIPKRFLKSQNLLNRYLDNDPILTKLLVIDPEKRSTASDLVPSSSQSSSNDQCVIS